MKKGLEWEEGETERETESERESLPGVVLPLMQRLREHRLSSQVSGLSASQWDPLSLFLGDICLTMFKTRFTLSILPLALRDRMSHDSTPTCHIRHGESSERARWGDALAVRMLNLRLFHLICNKPRNRSRGGNKQKYIPVCLSLTVKLYPTASTAQLAVSWSFFTSLPLSSLLSPTRSL